MDCLCSRPTAVNLSDAAHKLGSLAEERAAESSSSGQHVTKAVIEACKQMLLDDVEANKVVIPTIPEAKFQESAGPYTLLGTQEAFVKIAIIHA